MLKQLITVNLCLAFFTISMFAQNSCRQVDSLTLVELQNNLTFKSEFEWDLDKSMDTWHGVLLNPDGCVHSLDLASAFRKYKRNQAYLSDSITGLQQLSYLDLSDNNLENLYINFSQLPAINTVNLHDNKLVFSDLEYVPAGINFTYSPQEYSHNHSNINYVNYVGMKEYLYLNHAGNGSIYTWSKDGVPVDTIISSQLIIPSLQLSDAGVYTAEISHPNFPDLVIQSLPLTLYVGTPRERDSLILVDFYKRVIFKNNEWNLNQPMNTWYGVVLSPIGSVTRLEIPNTLDGGQDDYFFNDYYTSNLLDLTHLDLRNNGLDRRFISGYPPNISSVKISGNRMTFNDLNYVSPPSGAVFEYAPQATQELTTNLIAKNTGESATVTTNGYMGSNTGNVFNWYKDGQLWFTTSASNLNFSYLQTNNVGLYTCQITNPDYLNLTIYTDSVRVVVDDCRMGDSLALVELYKAVNFAPGHGWDLAQPVGTWEGITTDPDEGCVEEINLPYTMTGGTLPKELLTINELGYLNLSGNDLEISMESGYYYNKNIAPNLYHVDLSYNQISGRGYAWFLGSYMEKEGAENYDYLDLSHNQIEYIYGIYDLINLQLLDLSHNNINGYIGSLLPQSQHIINILLYNNQITGAIEDSHISEYNYLNNLRIENNQVSDITPELYNLPQLEEITVYNNKLTFEDLDATYFAPMPELYTPQDTVGEAYTIYLEPYTELNYAITLDFDHDVPNNYYSWYKDGEELAVTQENSYELLDIIPEYAGVYTCVVTNSDLPDLVLQTAPITVLVDSAYGTCLLRDSLAILQVLPEYAWQLGTPLKYWNGIEVSEEGCVTEISYADDLSSFTISPAIGMLLDVERIILDENGIAGHIPSSIGQLTQLKYLNLSENNLTSFPYELTTLPNLEYLNLRRNKINEVPSQWASTPKLTQLYLDRNKITQVPSGIASAAPNLQDLNLSSNQISVLPTEIANLSQLKYLGISNNPLSETPHLISNIGNLEKLYMSNCGLFALPDNLGNLEYLTDLYISDNPLGELPTDIGLLANLETFQAENCELLTLPDEFSNLVNLKYLYLSNNYLQGFPPNFAQNLTQLSYPRVAHNQLTFEDLIPLNTYNGSYYVEQNTVGTPRTIYATTGSDVTIDLGFDENVTSSTYQWFHFTDEAATTNTNQLVLTNIQADDAGPYSCRITNPAYTSITLETYQIQLVIIGEEVYPGDANSDGIVDNEDVLFWGLVTGSTGPVRPNASAEWIPQFAQDWTNYLLGVNGKHQDADGNGIVDDGDLDIIEANYYNTTDFYEQTYSNESQLQLAPSVTSAQNFAASSEYTINLDLSSIMQGTATVHGLAFTADFSQLQTAESYAVQIDESVSWIAPSEVVQVHDEAAHRSDFVITRTDLQNQIGMGTVASLGVVTENLPTIGKPSIGLTLRNICAIQSDGTILHAEDVFVGSFGENNPNAFITTLEFDAVAYAATCDEPSSATVNVKSGNAPYQYQWSNGDTNPIAEDLTPGHYEVTVTDAFGQSLEGFVEVPNGTPLPDIQLQTNTNGEIEIIHNNPDATFLWNGQVAGNLAALAPGEHTLEVGNSMGCSKTMSVWVADIFTNILLEGNYDTAPQLMHDDLRRLGLIPLTDPYIGTMTMPSTVLDTTGSTAIVDWVLVELHDANEYGKVISATPALLRRDGEIVANDGISPIRVAVPEVSDYYLIIKHRNHLPVKSAVTKTLTAPIVTHDFGSGSSSLQKQLSNNQYCLFAADVSGENSIDGLDKTLWVPVNGNFNEYHPADINLDGDINGADKAIWYRNNGTFTDIE